jgi:hypothetical protein
MTITLIPAPLDIRSTHATPNTQPRSSGIHLSGIIRKMALAANKLPPQYAAQSLTHLINETPVGIAGESGTIMRLGLGFAWEYWIVPHVQSQMDFVHQPGEFIRDNIRTNPDGLGFNPTTNTPIIHEFKATWKSASKPIEDEFMWLCQIMGEAAVLAPDYGYCEEAYLHVAYINGDYKRDTPTSGPKYRRYQITMNQDEIERVWAEIVANRDGVEPESWGGAE